MISSTANLSPKRSHDIQNSSPFLSTKRIRSDSVVSDSFTDGNLSLNDHFDDDQAAQDIVNDKRNSTHSNLPIPPSNRNLTVSETSSNEVEEISEEIGEGFIQPITEFKIGIATLAQLALNKSPIRSSDENILDIHLPLKPLAATPLIVKTFVNSSSESSIEDEGETRWKAKEIVLLPVNQKKRSWLETIMN
jgi:hypothetical protein